MLIIKILVLLIILFLIYGYVSNFILQIQRVKYPCDHPSFTGTRFVLLADLHGACFGKKNLKLINVIKKENPNGILIAGDMVVKDGKGTDEAIHLCKELIKICPVYYGLGNHEIRLENREEFIDDLKNVGVHVLDNTSFTIIKGNDELTITGLTLEMDYYQKFWEPNTLSVDKIESMIGKSKNDGMQLLIAHNPEYFERYQEWGSDLVVSGHVHGGIMTLPFGGVLAPNLRIFPRYTHGVYSLGDCKMVLSKGLGLHHIKLRFFNYPEIITILFNNK